MDPRVAHFTDLQEGVVARRQLIATGLAPHGVRRLLRRRELASICSGVYVTHTGEPSWRQQAWAAVLATSHIDHAGRPSGAALSHSSALHAERRTEPRSGNRIHICVDANRTVTAPTGVIVHRRVHLARQLHPSGRPPRISFDHSAIDAASQASPVDAVGILAQAVNERRTSPNRLLRVVVDRNRLRQRAWLCAVLKDIAKGTHSVLEHGFLTKVLRPHQLPNPDHQHRECTPLGVVYRDTRYGTQIIELDGRAHHSSREQHAADLDRDLLAAASGRHTLRLGWRQVFETPCRTAAALSHLLEKPGKSCGTQCSFATTERRIRATR